MLVVELHDQSQKSNEVFLRLPRPGANLGSFFSLHSSTLDHSATAPLIVDLVNYTLSFEFTKQLFGLTRSPLDSKNTP